MRQTRSRYEHRLRLPEPVEPRGYRKIDLVLDVTTPPAGWSPGPAARAHWGRWGGLFRSVASYNVTKCDMRRSMCRSDVSVNAYWPNRVGYAGAAAHNFGR